VAAIVQSSVETVLNTPATNHNLNTPATLDGERLLAQAVTGKNNLSPGTTWPAGWIELVDLVANIAVEGTGVTQSWAYRDFPVGAAAGTVNAQTVNNCTCVGVVLRISGHDPATPPEASIISGPDSPNLITSWGSESTLFGAGYSSNEDPFPGPVYPLPDNQHQVDGSQLRAFSCTQVVSGASLDPAAWQGGGAEFSGRVSVTWAVRGAAAGVDLEQLTEADAVQAVTARKSKVAAQLSELDTITALTVFKTQLMAQLAEADEVLAFAGGVKTMPLGAALQELDALGGLGAASPVLLQGLELDEVLPLVGGVKSKPLAQLTTLDALQALSAVKRQAVAMLFESDTLGDIGVQQILGILVETDVLLPLLGGAPLPDDAHATSVSGLSPGTVIGAPGLRMVASASSLTGLRTTDTTSGLEL